MTHRNFSYDKILALVIFFIISNAWGACRQDGSKYEVVIGSQTFSMTTSSECSGSYPYSNKASVESMCNQFQCPKVKYQNGYYFTNLTPSGSSSCKSGNGWDGSAFGCDPPHLSFGSSCYPDSRYICNNTYCFGEIMCDTEAEADSAYCAINPQAEGCTPPDSTWQIKSCTYIDSLNLYLNEIRDYFRISGNTSSKGISYLYPSCDTTNFDTLHVCNLSRDTCSAHSSAYRGISLKDSSVSNADTTLYYDCYYNCANNCNADSSMCTVEGNYLFDARSGAIGTKVPNAFDAMRYVDNGSYEYDFLSPAAYTYVIDLLGAECSLYLYRGKLNGKYIYWYSNQEAPAGVTNIVRIK